VQYVHECQPVLRITLSESGVRDIVGCARTDEEEGEETVFLQSYAPYLFGELTIISGKTAENVPTLTGKFAPFSSPVRVLA
jgi:hypothetical protein